MRPDLPIAFEAWLAAQAPAENLIIVGGGELIDAVRHLDKVRPLDSGEVHWRCIHLLTTTFKIVGDWFPAWQRLDSPGTFARCVDFGFSSSQPTLVRVTAFYQPSHNASLPLDWRTTTDAIATLLGNLSSADEVVLLKSCDVDASLTVDQLVSQGIIDEAVPLLEHTFSRLRVEKLPEQAARKVEM